MNQPPAAKPQTWHYRKRRAANSLFWLFASLATIIALIPLGLLLSYVVARGLPGLNLAFFTRLPAPVGEAGGGMLNAIIGTLVLVGLASLIGLPFGIIGGIYLAEFGNNRFGSSVRFAADVLNGVPSIVIGSFIYTIVVLQTHQFSALAGGLALGMIMIPTVMRTTEELVRLVPLSQREASLSLGASQSRTILQIVLLSAKAGVITGALLAIARIAGEAAPLLVTSPGSMLFNTSLNQPIASLPVQIYLYANAPYDEWNRQAWAAALVLVMMVTIFSLAARYATRGKFRIVR